MIATREYKNIQTTLIHRITGEISIEEAKTGSGETVNIFQAAIKAFKKWHRSSEYAPWKKLRKEAMDINMVLAKRMPDPAEVKR